ncbi:MAG: hydrogenase maturation protease [Candidatus Heimdallarchaeaceae archaeon]
MNSEKVSEPFTDEFIETIDNFLVDAEKLAILGIGNEDNGDDAVGLHVLKILQKEDLPEWVVNFYCERVPEHFLGKIRKFGPNRIILLDAADMKEVPGAIGIFPKEAVSSGFHLSTHTLSVTMLEEFLKPEVPDLITLYVGIQPKQMYFQSPLSTECIEAGDEFAELLIERIKLADSKREKV